MQGERYSSAASDQLLGDSGVTKRPESQELIDGILGVATRLFHEKGYLGTTTQEIADEAEITKGTLYYHIHHKNEILYRIHRRVTEELIRRWEAVLCGGGRPSDLLRSMLREHVHLVSEWQDWVAVTAEEMKFLEPQYVGPAQQMRDHCHSQLEGVVERGVAEGEFETGSVGSHTLLIWNMLSAVYRWFRQQGPMTEDEIADLLWGIVLEGLRRDPVPDARVSTEPCQRP